MICLFLISGNLPAVRHGMEDGRVEMEEGRGNLPAVRHGMGDGRGKREPACRQAWDGRGKREPACRQAWDGRGKREEGTCLPSGMGWEMGDGRWEMEDGRWKS